jgi:penicillin-insensitive murein endopeptidase
MAAGRHRRSGLTIVVAAALVAIPALVGAAESVCYGTTGNGRLEGGVRIPRSGPNFAAYSSLGVALGRTYVHAKVEQVIAAAYASLAASHPEKSFVYGESGWARGGRIRPHRTHQNGLAVDFVVPVLDAGGRSVPLPTGPFNKFG